MDILIVEDEPAIRQMLIFALEEEGHNAFEAENASEAQRTLNDHKPDLILLDWMLPGISGSDFASRLKKNPKTNISKTFLGVALDFQVQKPKKPKNIKKNKKNPKTNISETFSGVGLGFSIAKTKKNKNIKKTKGWFFNRNRGRN